MKYIQIIFFILLITSAVFAQDSLSYKHNNVIFENYNGPFNVDYDKITNNFYKATEATNLNEIYDYSVANNIYISTYTSDPDSLKQYRTYYDNQTNAKTGVLETTIYPKTKTYNVKYEDYYNKYNMDVYIDSTVIETQKLRPYYDKEYNREVYKNDYLNPEVYK
jgi:hypothetical protein